MTVIAIEVACKPNTCGNCRWWRYADRTGSSQPAPGPTFCWETREPYCRIWKRWLERNRHHVYRCGECKESEL